MCHLGADVFLPVAEESIGVFNLCIYYSYCQIIVLRYLRERQKLIWDGQPSTNYTHSSYEKLLKLETDLLCSVRGVAAEYVKALLVGACNDKTEWMSIISVRLSEFTKRTRHENHRSRSLDRSWAIFKRRPGRSSISKPWKTLKNWLFIRFFIMDYVE